MKKELFNIVQSEVEIAKCRKYQSDLIEKTIQDLVAGGHINYADMIARARKLDPSSLYFFDFKVDEFEYFRAAVVRVLEERQLCHSQVEP
ncbi:MAG: hypothetical protein OEY87_01975 [Gammaproteobacteria bacterium]|nr:hypothetical protein [Gammaproteobacteria bacterium]MDH5734866.1 hypothetical protein [Gammaproteobacteria bacterium]